MSEEMDPTPVTTATHAMLAFDFSGSWNIFRRAGDMLHLVGTFLLLATIVFRGSTRGISWKSQLLYLVVFVTRYLDLPHNIKTFMMLPAEASRMQYLIVFKLTYILAQFLILYLFWRLKNNGVKENESHKDTCNIWFILVPYFFVAFFFSSVPSTEERLWTYSEYIEAFAMVPQYIFQYRSDRKGVRLRCTMVEIWIFCIGSYRCFYFCNWIWKEYHQMYVASHSLIGGFLQNLLFFDFLLYLFSSISCLRTLTLSFDDRVNDASDAIELTVFPNRAPEVEQKRLRRRNLNDATNPYQQIEIHDPVDTIGAAFDDVL